MSTQTEAPLAAPAAAQTLWSVQPGWGIAADLTPPELIASRRVRMIRTGVIVVLVALLLLCGVGYGAAMWQNHGATSALADAQARTAQLQAEQNKYAAVTMLQGSVAEVQKQVAGLMGNDVAFAALVGALRQQLPPGMTISQLAVTIDTKTTGAPAGAAASAPGGASNLDASGQRHIGTVALSGTGTKVSDVAAFLDRLTTVPGVLEPFPLTNQATPNGVQYSLQMTLGDTLLTHQYDKLGGK